MLPFQMLQKAEHQAKQNLINKTQPAKQYPSPSPPVVKKTTPVISPKGTRISKNTLKMQKTASEVSMQKLQTKTEEPNGLDISILNPNFRFFGLEDFLFPFNLIPDFKGTIDTKTGEVNYTTENLNNPSPNEIIINPSITGHEAEYGSNISDEIKKNVENALNQMPSITQPFKDLPKLPDFSDIGKWVLIGGGLLLAILILPKLIPQRR